MRNIPNLITSLNLISGFVAIVFASKGDLVTASWLILAAMIFDFFDGFAARSLKAYSDIGKELDSLADLVSFGVAPAFIIYRMIVTASNISPESVNTLTIKDIFAFITVIMPVCAALRLAIFNLDTTQKTSFRGLPTPANAIAVITVVIAAHITGLPFLEWFTGSAAALIIYTVILSLLMVTRLPLLSLKFANLRFAGNEPRYILIGLVLASYIFFGFASIPFIIPAYILVSLGSTLFIRS